MEIAITLEFNPLTVILPSMSEQNSLSPRQKRLIFRSWHRGTREMDLLLGSFADAQIPHMDDTALALYEALLNENDPDLYNWYSRREDVPENCQSAVMTLFLSHSYT